MMKRQACTGAASELSRGSFFLSRIEKKQLSLDGRAFNSRIQSIELADGWMIIRRNDEGLSPFP